MILFCEDCGKKNLLKSIRFTAGKPTFRCTSCGYLNLYHFKPKETLLLEQADCFFKEAKAFPEILGSFLFHGKLGVLKHHTPEILETETLEFMGKTLVKSYAACQSGIGDVEEMVLALADKNMILKFLGENFFMILLCKTISLPQVISEKFFTLSEPDKPSNR